MKSFNTLQELWDYCLYCPVCQRNCRQIHLSVGPDDTFIIVNFDKVDSFLNLQCIFKTAKSRSFSLNFKIDCQNNSFDSEVYSVSSGNSPQAKDIYFFFFLEGLCPECNCSSAHSLDMELNFHRKKISDIGLELEDFCLLKAPNKFRIDIVYHTTKPDTMIISKIRTTPNDPHAEIEFIDDHKSIELPVIKLDFSDQTKLSNRIKTLILFS